LKRGAVEGWKYYMESRKEEQPTFTTTKECYQDWLHLAWELPTKTVVEGKIEGTRRTWKKK
jgi:hypothetical protein